MNEQEAKKGLEAAELLLANVQKQRAALDQREQQLRDETVFYRTQLQQLGSKKVIQLPIPDSVMLDEQEIEDDDAREGHGSITAAIVRIMRQKGRKMNALEVADALERQGVTIRAKTYYSAVRTSMRRLYQTKKIKRVGGGYYRLDKDVEAQAS